MRRFLHSTALALVLALGLGANEAQAVPKTQEFVQNPTVTASNSYGTNFVVGGLLTFNNVFQPIGTGILQSVKLTFKNVQSGGFTIYVFEQNPSGTTWTDAAVSNIAAADSSKLIAVIPTSCVSSMGTSHTICSADGLAMAIAPVPAGQTLWVVVLSNAALTNQFTSATDMFIKMTFLDD